MTIGQIGNMFKQRDWICLECGRKFTDLYDVPHGCGVPSFVTLHCPTCGESTLCMRTPSVPSPYMGEKVLNPSVSGGTYDTMGCRQGPPLPDLPGADAHQEHVAAKLAEVPANAPPEARADVLRETCKTAPSSADYSTMFATPEYQHAQAECSRVKTENQEKRQRAAAIARGDNINMRRDKCAGDPDIAA